MSSVNDYINRYNERKQNLNPDNNSGDATLDSFQALRNQQYDLLLDREVALENAKANAMKYTQNQINAQGLGGTGYGSTLNSGIYNAYLNKANEAMGQYSSNIADINLKEQEHINELNAENANNQLDFLLSAMEYPDEDMSSVNNLLSEMGYGTLDNDTFTWNNKPEGMSDIDWMKIKYAYQQKQNLINSSGNADVNSIYNNLANMTFEINGNSGEKGETRNKGTVSTLGEWFKEESKLLAHKAGNGELAKGSVIYVKNGRDDVIYLRWNGNKFVSISQKDFLSQKEHRYKLSHQNYSNSWGVYQG